MENSIARRIEALNPQQRGELARRLAARAGMKDMQLPFPRLPHEPVRVSYAQERLLIAHEADPDSGRYNTFFALRLEGRLRIPALVGAIRQLVSRHSALRTRFELRTTGAVQIVSAHSDVLLQYVDLTGVPEADSLATAVARRETTRPFNLLAGPVMRALIVYVSADLHMLVLTVHHIVSDRWSAQILGRELMLMYASERGSALLPPLKFEYADFAAWQRLRVEENLLRSQIDYWRSQLLPVAPALKLGRNGGKAVTNQGKGGRIARPLAAELVEALERLSRSCAATLFMTCLAAFHLLLRRWSAETDIVVGIPVTNRSSAELQRLVGFFLNTLLVRVRVPDHCSFEDLLARVRDASIEAMANGELPFEVVCEACGLHSHASHASPYQVLFTLNDIHDPTSTGPAAQSADPTFAGDIKVAPLFTEVGGIVAGLALHIERNVSRTNCLLEYDSTLVEPAEALLLLEAYVTLLESVVRHPQRPLMEHALLTSRQREHELLVWNQSESAYPAEEGLADLFGAAVRRNPQQVAVEYREGRVSYRELEERADELAARLLELGVPADGRVGICIERSPQFVIAALGIIKAGAAYVPIDTREPAARIAGMAVDSGMAVLVTVSHHVGMLEKLADKVAILDVEARDSPIAGPSSAQRQIHSLQLACVIYTSGSTGRPKGVGISHRGIARLVKNTNYLSFSERDRVGHLSNVAFDAATMEIWGALLNGATLVVLDHEDLLLPGAPSGAHLTSLFLTTALFQQVARNNPAAIAGVESVLFGGERCDPRIASAVARSRAPRQTVHLYGPAEGTTLSTWLRIDPREEYAGSIPIGRPVSNTRCYVLDACMQPLPPHVVGELHIAGDGLARGYLNNPALTAERFVPDPYSGVQGARMYRSGDLVMRLPSGDIDFIGRRDNQVKLRGFRIELEEVRASLRSLLPDVEVEIVMREQGNGRASLVAYLQTPVRLDSRRIQADLRARLPEHMVPSACVCVQKFPLTFNGKIDYADLPPPKFEDAEYVSPQTPTESAVARLWERALGLERVSVAADFFSTGGNSLMALQIVTAVREQFGAPVNLRTFLENLTVSGLARAIDRIVAEAHPPRGDGVLTANPEDRFAPFALTDLQQAYWIGRTSNFDLGGVSAHAYFELDVPGVELPRLGKAFNKLIYRHDALRTIVRQDGLQQVLQETPEYRIPMIVLTGVSESAVGQATAALRRKMSHQVLPSDQWPLFDFRVCLLPSGALRLHMSIDALIADAWSWRLIIGELARLYLDPKTSLAPIDLTFRDYVVYKLWQRGSPEYTRSYDYWCARFANFPPAPALPVLPEKVAGARFGRRFLHLNAERWQAITDQAKRESVSSSVAVLAAFSEVITFWSTVDRYALNLTSFDRSAPHPDIERVVGDFTSVLLLEIAHDPSRSFAERADRIQRQLWRDMDHRAMSGVAVMRELRRHRGGEAVLYPVVFTSLLGLPLEPGSTATRLPRATSVFSVSQTPQVWLDCQVYEDATGLAVSWDALEEIFPQGLLDDMFAAFAAALESLTGHDAWHQHHVELLPAWQRALFDRVNSTSQAFGSGQLQDGFLAQVDRNPENPAIISEGGVLTYRELALRVAAVAREVRGHDLSAVGLVAVIMEKGWEQVAAVLGILEAGYAYVPIDPQLPAKRIAFLLQSTGIALILTQGRLESAFERPAQVRVLCVDQLGGVRVPVSRGTLCGGDRLAYVIFTSGSTGEPKGVMITHHAALNTIAHLNERFQIQPTDRVLALSSLSFDLSVYDIFGTLAAGAALVIPQARSAIDPTHWHELVVMHSVSVWNSVPAIMGMYLEHLSQASTELPASLRLVLLSGDWIPLPLAKELLGGSRAPRMVSLGGATEASIWSIAYEVTQVQTDWPSVPYGQPLRNQGFQILDSALRPRPVWVPGALSISGQGLALGYWNDAAKTAQQFVPDPVGVGRLYLTGDRGRYLPDGNIQFLGREDTQIKLGGYRIELGEIESQLGRHPEVGGCIVLVSTSDAGVRHLIACVVPAEGAQPDPGRLRDFLAETLPDYMIPVAFAMYPSFPLTDNGKVDRRRLLASCREHSAGTTPAPDKETALEHVICDIFASELHLERVTVEDNFFMLGGQSLTALGIRAQVKEKIGVDLPLKTLFRASTPRALAAALNLSSQLTEKVRISEEESNYEEGTL